MKVKSNHHLSELLKMAFRRRDPDLVTLFVLAGSVEGGLQPPPASDGGSAATAPESPGAPATKAKRYRVARRGDLIQVLQRNMERFK